MDTETLIGKVFLKPAIWDKRLKSYSNRILVDRCWQNIATDMGIRDTALLRKKWKYLRDQFSVEYGKVHQPRSEDAGGIAYEPKWPHFKALYFLKDIVRPRGNPSSKRTATDEDIDDTQKQSMEDLFPAVERTFEEVTGVGCERHVEVEDNHSPPKRKRREHTIYDSITAMEAKTVRFLEKFMDNRQREDEDLLFFRSLLPHVGKIPDHVKLRFRNRIQEVVEEFAYGSPSSTFQLCHNSLSNST